MNIGFDLCNPKRIEEIYKRFGSKFLKRVLTEKEIDELLNSKSKKTLIHRLAGRYSAKEAIAKLFGTGIGKTLGFQDIEILRGDNGQPKVVLKEAAAQLAKKLKFGEVSISISHEDIMVGAVATA